jgi:hypothetical protein
VPVSPRRWFRGRSCAGSCPAAGTSTATEDWICVIQSWRRLDSSRTHAVPTLLPAAQAPQRRKDPAVSCTLYCTNASPGVFGLCPNSKLGTRNEGGHKSLHPAESAKADFVLGSRDFSRQANRDLSPPIRLTASRASGTPGSRSPRAANRGTQPVDPRGGATAPGRSGLRDRVSTPRASLPFQRFRPRGACARGG